MVRKIVVPWWQNPDEYSKVTYSGDHNTEKSRKHLSETNLEAKKALKQTRQNKKTEIESVTDFINLERSILVWDLKYKTNPEELVTALLTVDSNFKADTDIDGENREFEKVFGEYVNWVNTHYKLWWKTWQDWYLELKSDENFSGYSSNGLQFIADILKSKWYSIKLWWNNKIEQVLNLTDDLSIFRNVIGLYQFMNWLKVDNKIGPEVLRSLAGGDTKVEEKLKKDKDEYEKKEKQIWKNAKPRTYLTNVNFDGEDHSTNKNTFDPKSINLYKKEYTYNLSSWVTIKVIANYAENSNSFDYKTKVFWSDEYLVNNSESNVEVIKLEDVTMDKIDTNYADYSIWKYSFVDQEYFEEYAKSEADAFNSKKVRKNPNTNDFYIKWKKQSTNPKISAVSDANEGLVNIDKNLILLQEGFDKRAKLMIESTNWDIEDLSTFKLDDVSKEKIKYDVSDLAVDSIEDEELDINLNRKSTKWEISLVYKNKVWTRWDWWKFSYDKDRDVEYFVVNEDGKDLVKLTLVNKERLDSNIDIKEILELESWEDHIKLMKFISKNNKHNLLVDLWDLAKKDNAKKELMKYKNYEEPKSIKNIGWAMFDRLNDAPWFLETMFPYGDMGWADLSDISNLMFDSMDVLYWEKKFKKFKETKAYSDYMLIWGLSQTMAMLVDNDEKYIETWWRKTEKKSYDYYINFLKKAKRMSFVKGSKLSFPVTMYKKGTDWEKKEVVVDYEIIISGTSEDRWGIVVKWAEKISPKWSEKSQTIVWSKWDYDFEFTDINYQRRSKKSIENSEKLKLSIMKIDIWTKEERESVLITGWAKEVDLMFKTKWYKDEFGSVDWKLGNEWKTTLEYMENLFPYNYTDFKQKRDIILYLKRIVYRDIEMWDVGRFSKKFKTKDKLEIASADFLWFLKTLDLLFSDKLKISGWYTLKSTPEDRVALLNKIMDQYQDNKSKTIEDAIKSVWFSIVVQNDEDGQEIVIPMGVNIYSNPKQKADYSMWRFEITWGLLVEWKRKKAGSNVFVKEIWDNVIKFTDKTALYKNVNLELEIKTKEEMKFTSWENELNYYVEGENKHASKKDKKLIKPFVDELSKYMDYDTISTSDKKELMILMFPNGIIDWVENRRSMKILVDSFKSLNWLYSDLKKSWYNYEESDKISNLKSLFDGASVLDDFQWYSEITIHLNKDWEKESKKYRINVVGKLIDDKGEVLFKSGKVKK